MFLGTEKTWQQISMTNIHYKYILPKRKNLYENVGIPYKTGGQGEFYRLVFTKHHVWYSKASLNST